MNLKMRILARSGVLAILVLALGVASGCASGPKPKKDPYTGVMGNRGIIPPAYSMNSGRPQTLSGNRGPAAEIPAPTDSSPAIVEGDSFVALPTDDAPAEASSAPVVIQEDLPAAETAPAAAAAPKRSFPVIPNGNVPSAGLSGKSVKPAVTPTAGATYVVKSGDSLSRIAKDHGVRVSDIMALNPKVTAPNKIMVGQELVLPTAATAGASAAPAAAKDTAAPKSAAPKKAREAVPADGIYTVVANDSLWKIGDRFGVAVSDLRTWNGLTSDRLKLGQQLKVRGDAAAPAAAAPAKDAAPANEGPVSGENVAVAAAEEAVEATTPAPAPQNLFSYAVGEGDTIDSICTAMEMTREALLQANPQIRTDADLKSGMIIKVIMPD